VSVRHRLEYAALRGLTGLAAGLSHVFSLGVLVEAAAWLGQSYVRLAGPRVDVARINLAIAFPDWEESEREAVLVESFANVARSVAELLLLQGPYREDLLARVGIEGDAELRRSLASSPSGSVIALTAHFGSWELCGAGAAKLGFPLCVVHRSFDNPLVEEQVKRWRERAGLGVVALGSAGLAVLRALRRGQVVVMLADQDAHRSEGVFADFFSRAASTRSGPALVAMTTKTPILPIFAFRQRDAGAGPQHILRVGSPIAMEPGDEDDEAALKRNVARMNAAIEQAIRLAPDQWMWGHRRWRTQPDGAPRTYPSRRGRD
jgi:KDO2-lipid IV(A) lauroyltransferase